MNLQYRIKRTAELLSDQVQFQSVVLIDLNLPLVDFFSNENSSIEYHGGGQRNLMGFEVLGVFPHLKPDLT